MTFGVLDVQRHTEAELSTLHTLLKCKSWAAV